MIPIPLILIVEDPLSECVAKKILEQLDRNYQVISVLHWNKDKIRTKIKDINQSAGGSAYFVLTDQDIVARCPPKAIKELSQPIHSNLLYRFSVMEIESWVMAHREAVSPFLSIPLNRIPANVDTITDPKAHLTALAKKSKSSSIRKDIPPPDNSTSKVGPDYNGRLSEFVMTHWDMDIALQHSPSLKRTVERLRHFSPKVP